MTLPVFLVPVADARVGDRIELDGAEGRHAKTVRRIGVGELLEIVDGRGTRLRGEVCATTEGGLLVQVSAVSLENQLQPTVTLVQALAKGGRDDMAVEICTELGVDRIVPWQADRSIVRWVGTKAEKGRQKWANQVISAAKQSRRARFPEVGSVVTSGDLTAVIAQTVAAGGLALVCHEDATASVTAVISAQQSATEVMIVIGPEGGISAEETAAFVGAGAHTVSLGPTVLRSSTAGAVGVMAVNLGLNRW